MPSDNARGSKEPIALDDLSGADVTISEAELQIGEKAVAWADVEIVGLSRLAPTSVWSPLPTSRMSIGRRAMDPPVPVFCCTIITRSGIVSNVLSIAMNDSELLIDRAASYRVFVTRLHEHLARAGSDALTSQVPPRNNAACAARPRRR